MVSLGLKTFIETEVQNAGEIIAIEQKIKEWKCVNRGATPIIVIHFIGFCNVLSRSKQLDILFGNHGNIIKITESVFRRFKEMGVQLEIFYCGTSNYIVDGKFCAKRIYRGLNQTKRLLNVIKRESSTKKVIKQMPYIYSNSIYVPTAIMLAEKYGTVHKSYKNEVNRDIAMYATKHHAIAVMTWDYEFILMNNKLCSSNSTESLWYFWDLKSFRPNTFKILQIDNTKVQTFFKLTDNEFSIFGALINDNLRGQVNYFLKTHGPIKYQFENIAKVVKEKLSHRGLVVPIEIASILDPKYTDENIRIAENNLKLFVNDIEPDEFYEDELSNVTKRIHNSFVFEYLNDLHVEVFTSYWSKTSFLTYMDHVISILRRQMGVVLKHKVGQQNRSIICCNHQDIEIKVVKPEYPLLEVPSLLRLFERTTDESLRKIKLQLLCWIISVPFDYTIIENIEKQYLCSVLTLVYLVQNQFISSEDADCILYCLLKNKTDPQSMELLKHPDSITEQPLQLVFLYTKFYQYTIISMNTVGLSELLEHNELNGVYFHMQYEQFINYSAEQRNNLLQMFNGYRLYLNK